VTAHGATIAVSTPAVSAAWGPTYRPTGIRPSTYAGTPVTMLKVVWSALVRPAVR